MLRGLFRRAERRLRTDTAPTWDRECRECREVWAASSGDLQSGWMGLDPGSSHQVSGRIASPPNNSPDQSIFRKRRQGMYRIPSFSRSTGSWETR